MANARIGNALPFKGIGSNYIETIDTTGKQLAANDSGKTFFISQNDTADTLCYLPTISKRIAGWNAKFILKTPADYKFKILPYGGVTGGGTGSMDDKMRFQKPAGPLRGNATVDVSSLSDGAGASFDITVTGAGLGDACIAAPSVDAQEMLITANVRAANTVEVRVQHEATGGAIDLASTVWYAYVWDKFGGTDLVDNVSFMENATVGAEIDVICDGTHWWAIARGRDTMSFASTDS